MTSREREILRLLEKDPLLSQQAIASALGITRSAVAGHIRNMTAKGIIRGRAYVLGNPDFVAVIGGAAVDIHGRSMAPLRRNDSNPGRISVTPGGVARNIAENLGRLGVQSRLLTVVGQDPHGELILRHTKAAGVDTRFVRRDRDVTTACYLAALNATGELEVAISDQSALDTFEHTYLQQHESMLKRARVIVADTNLPDDALRYLCTRFPQVPLFVDTVSAPKAPRIRPLLSAVHTITPSLAEAQELSGIGGGGNAALKAIGRWFHDQGVERVFVTRGKKGLFFSVNGEQDTLPAMETGATVSTNGAGDAFAAALTAAWIEGWELQKSLRFALAASCHTLGDPETVSPTLNAARLQSLSERNYVS